MALPDISGLTLEELRDLAQAASLAAIQAEADRDDDRDAAKVKISQAIASLEALLGPEGAAPSTNSINGVLAFTDAQMAANAGLAFRTTFIGLKALTKTVLDLARVVD
jgi:hypothetical protein